MRLIALDLHCPIVVALPRGGVPVAMPIANRLGSLLDVLLIRKVGVPGHRELAVGAVSDGQGMQFVLNEYIAERLKLSHHDVVALAKREVPELERRRQLYFADQPPKPLSGKTVILVDDGMATGATARMALRLVRQQNPLQIILALPVAPASSIAELSHDADAVICLHQPEPFHAVGAHYRSFDQVSDDTVATMLRQHRISRSATSHDNPDEEATGKLPEQSVKQRGEPE